MKAVAVESEHFLNAQDKEPTPALRLIDALGKLEGRTGVVANQKRLAILKELDQLRDMNYCMIHFTKMYKVIENEQCQGGASEADVSLIGKMNKIANEMSDGEKYDPRTAHPCF